MFSQSAIIEKGKRVRRRIDSCNACRLCTNLFIIMS